MSCSSLMTFFGFKCNLDVLIYTACCVNPLLEFASSTVDAIEGNTIVLEQFLAFCRVDFLQVGWKLSDGNTEGGFNRESFASLCVDGDAICCCHLVEHFSQLFGIIHAHEYLPVAGSIALCVFFGTDQNCQDALFRNVFLNDRAWCVDLHRFVLDER